MTTINPTKQAGRVCGEIANNTDTLKKASSVGTAFIDIIMNTFSYFPSLADVKGSFGVLKGRLKDMNSVIGAVSLLGRLYEWADPAEREKIINPWKKFGANYCSPKVHNAIPKSWVWVKAANRIMLLAAQALETVGFVDKHTAAFFSQAALSIGGAIPIFDVVKNSLYALSSLFGLTHASLELAFAYGNIKLSTDKKEKWEQRSMELGGIESFRYDEVVEKYQAKLAWEQGKGGYAEKRKIDKYKTFINHLTTGHNADTHKENVESFQSAKEVFLSQKYARKIETLGTSEVLGGHIMKLEDIISRKEDVFKTSSDSKEKKTYSKQIKADRKLLAQLKVDVVKSKKLETYVHAINNGHAKKLSDYKVEVHKTRIHNNEVLKNKSWISIAAEVGKIFMIVVGMLIFGLSLIFPVLTLPAVALAMAFCGLAASSFGLAKNIYANVISKAETINKMPEFSVV